MAIETMVKKEKKYIIFLHVPENMLTLKGNTSELFLLLYAHINK
jgi:hypothetical protein